MSQGGTAAQTVGSVLLVDSTISNTPIGISTAYSTSEGATNGTLIIDNVDMSTNVPVAVSNAGKSTILAGNAKIAFVDPRASVISLQILARQSREPKPPQRSLLAF